jgi:hypothetical protein
MANLTVLETRPFSAHMRTLYVQLCGMLILFMFIIKNALSLRFCTWVSHGLSGLDLPSGNADINYILHCRKVGLYCPEIGFVARVHILQPEGPRVDGGEDPRAVIIARVLQSQFLGN